MNASRRSVIGGVVSLGLVCSGGFLWGRDAGSVTPRLKFGVVSDIHFVAERDGISSAGDAKTFEKTLRWFDAQGVDAVVCCGDLADRSLDTELQAVADAWFRVFPDNRAADGRPVARIFVTGNHDWEGHTYGMNVKRIYPDEAERAKHVLREDMAGWWKTCFHEEYRSVFRTDVKGYSFIGCHWEGISAYRGLFNFLNIEKPKLDPLRPFFVIQHPIPLGTCFGLEKPCADTDYGLTTKALADAPNAVVFSGHSHLPLTDDKAIWQGGFTSVAAGSLRYGFTSSRLGCENSCSAGKLAWKDDAAKLSPDEFGVQRSVRQGLLVTVYDDRIVYARRDFMTDQPLGPDWVQPLGTDERPLSFDAHAKTCGVPRFAENARLEVRREQAANRGGIDPSTRKPVPAVRQEVFAVTIPQVVADPSARVFFYEVTAESVGRKSVKRLYAHDYNRVLGSAKAKAKGPLVCRFAVADFEGPVKVAVRACNSFGVSQGALIAEMPNRVGANK